MFKLNSLLISIYFIGLFSCACQAQFLDSFRYSDHPHVTTWWGHSSEFYVENGILSSTSQKDNHQFYLACSTHHPLEFGFLDVQLDFNTSSKNYVDLILWSDKRDLEQISHGVFMRIGGTKDRIEVFEVQDGTMRSVNAFMEGQTHGFDARIAWLLDGRSEGKLKIWVGSDSMQAEVQNKPSDSTVVELLIRQSTKSFFGKHHFANFYWGKTVRDSTPPSLISAYILDSTALRVRFSEPMDTHYGGVECKNLRLAGIWSDEKELFIRSQESWPQNRTFAMRFEAFKDKESNVLQDTSIQLMYWHTTDPEEGEILFSELMIDPDPPWQLPNREYIELHNRSKKHFQLSNVGIRTKNGWYGLDSFVMKPGSFVVLADEDDKLRRDSSHTYLFLKKWPGLNNTEGKLAIESDALILDELEYDRTWLDDDLKEVGGWSLERIDSNRLCNSRNNWRFSEDKRGGTPGQVNSVVSSNPDEIPPRVQYYGVGENRVNVLFSEAMDTTMNLDFVLVIGHANEVTHFEFVSRKELLLILAEELGDKEVLKLTLRTFADCNKNQMVDTTLVLARAESAESGDIQFNEIMFDPFPISVEYVELVNTSQKVLDASTLRLASKEAGQIDRVARISFEHKLIFPGEYLLLSHNPTNLVRHYSQSSPSTFHSVTDMFTLKNDGETLYLMNGNLQVIDSMSYDESMHFELLEESKGTSLEKLAPGARSDQRGSWVSASETSGGGTPGRPNSQRLGRSHDAEISLINNVFSPNNDGINDRLEISVKSSSPLTMMRMRVFDLHGHEIQVILPRILSSTNFVTYWNGKNKYGKLAPPGSYIVLVDSYDSEGRRHRKKLLASLVSGP